jgi:hypothetical protein
MAFVSGKSLEKTSHLEDVVITEELNRRIPTERNLAAEASALHSLASGLNGSPQQLLVLLMEQALILCKGHTAGLSVLRENQSGEQCFCWDAMAGVLSQQVGGQTPRDFSPCGVTLNLRSPQLFKYPGRFFHYFLDVDPQMVEGLVVPVFVNRQGRGTIWIATHDESHHFTLTESKSMSSLASFTAAAIDLMERDANQSRPAGDKARTPAARRSQ